SANARTLDRVHVPPTTRGRTNQGHVGGAECEPGLAELQCVIEISERVELHRLATPRSLDASAQVGGQARRLTYVSSNDCLIHVRDPLRVASKKAFRGLLHPKGRITTSNPGLLGCSSSSGRSAGNRRSGAHDALEHEIARPVAAEQ